MELFLMCFEFFKTGLFSIGGGLATLPFLYQLADRYDWFTRSDLASMIAVSESTPGPMGVNMATYAGYTAFGIPGAVLATFSLVLPSILIILVVARFLQRFQESPIVRSVLYGIKPASVGLIASAAFGILKLALQFRSGAGLSTVISWKALGVGIVISFIYYFRRKWHPIVFILMGAVAGLVFSL